MHTYGFILGLTIAALRVGSPARDGGADPCALLTTAEIQTLAPNTRIGNGVSSTAAGPVGSAVCEYTWGAGSNVASGRYQLHVVVSDAAKAFPGMSPATVTKGMLSEAAAEDGGAHAAVITGVGEAAVFKSETPIRATATALAKGVMLQVNLEGADAGARKDQIIALLKSAVARL